MDSTFKKVQNFLREEDVGVIGIWGMGGVGKTTLLKRIKHECHHYFDVVIWLEVSQKFSVEKIQKEIGKILGLSQDLLASDISNALSSKKFLLLLDDIWRRVDLEKLGIPCTDVQKKCKVIFTTRSEEVCGQMEARRKIKVKPLKWEDALDLFRTKVGEELMNSDPHISRLAEDVVRECEGLPLALVTIGRSMRYKKTVEEWIQLKTVMINWPAKIPGMERDVFPLLKLSYDSLYDDTTKSCFLHCSLMPRAEIDRLVDHWIAEGLIDEYDNIDEARNSGLYLIGTLKDACLLEVKDKRCLFNYDTNDYVKMHKIIRGMALWIASDFGKKKNQFLAVECFSEATPNPERWTNAKSVCISGELSETPRCPNLVTLILNNSIKLKFSDNFFQFTPLLKVLDLSGMTDLRELPIGIVKLDKLQYLNLSSTDIETLPREVENLVNLKYLNLSYTKFLKTISYELIGGLPRLEVLDVYRRGIPPWTWKSCGDIESGADLTKLEGLKRLSDLSITISTDTVLDKFLASYTLQNCIRKLEIFFKKDISCFVQPSAFRGMNNLRKLAFSECFNLEEFIIDRTYELPPRLEELTLKDLERLKTILVRPVSLINLRTLMIYECGELTNIRCIVHLQNLEMIKLQGCYEMEEVIGGGGADEREEDWIGLPALKTIQIDNLPKLKSICRHGSSFPSLKSRMVLGCPQMKRLPLGLYNHGSSLGIRIIKSTFRPCFDEFEDEDEDEEYEGAYAEGEEAEEEKAEQLVASNLMHTAAPGVPQVDPTFVTSSSREVPLSNIVEDGHFEGEINTTNFYPLHPESQAFQYSAPSVPEFQTQTHAPPEPPMPRPEVVQLRYDLGIALAAAPGIPQMDPTSIASSSREVPLVAKLHPENAQLANMDEETFLDEDQELETFADLSKDFTTDNVFKERNDLIQWAKNVARNHGFDLAIKKSDGINSTRPCPRVFLGCKSSGHYRGCPTSKGQTSNEVRHTSTEHVPCPFTLQGQKVAGQDKWSLKIIKRIHNHRLSVDFEQYSHVRMLKGDELEASNMDLYNDITPKFEMIKARYAKANASQKAKIKQTLHEIADPPKTLLKEPLILDKPRRGRPKGSTTKQYTKVDKTTKRDPSAFEYVEKLPSKRSKKCDQDQCGMSFHDIRRCLPEFMFDFIQDAKDVIKDGHCGFRAVAGLLGMGNEGWRQVRKDLTSELHSHRDKYAQIYGDPNRIDELAKSLQCEEVTAAPQFWMSIPDMGYLIASCYKVVLVHISIEQSFTFLPLRSSPPPTHKLIAIGYINGNHFVQLRMTEDSPIPSIAWDWNRCCDPDAEDWQTPYIPRILSFRQKQQKIAPRETPDVVIHL